MPSTFLSSKTVSNLQPFFPTLDLAQVRVKTGIPRPVTWFGAVVPAAFASPSCLYFKPGHFDPDSPAGLAKIAHELKHVEQYRNVGKWTFIARYLREYRNNRKAGMTKHEAYRNIGFEQEAYAFERKVLETLTRAPSAAPDS